MMLPLVMLQELISVYARLLDELQGPVMSDRQPDISSEIFILYDVSSELALVRTEVLKSVQPVSMLALASYPAGSRGTTDTELRSLPNNRSRQSI